MVRDSAQQEEMRVIREGVALGAAASLSPISPSAAARGQQHAARGGAQGPAAAAVPQQAAGQAGGGLGGAGLGEIQEILEEVRHRFGVTLPPPPRLPAKRWLMDTATEINRRAILLRIYSGVSGGFASFHDCFGRLRAARPFTPLPSFPPYCGGTARRPSRSGGSARGGAAARGPRGPERCVPGEGPGWAGGGGRGLGRFHLQRLCDPGGAAPALGSRFPPSLPYRWAAFPRPCSPPLWVVPTHADPHWQPR